jgi:hypothetical protein
LSQRPDDGSAIGAKRTLGVFAPAPGREGVHSRPRVSRKKQLSVHGSFSSAAHAASVEAPAANRAAASVSRERYGISSMSLASRSARRKCESVSKTLSNSGVAAVSGAGSGAGWPNR